MVSNRDCGRLDEAHKPYNHRVSGGHSEWGRGGCESGLPGRLGECGVWPDGWGDQGERGGEQSVIRDAGREAVEGARLLGSLSVDAGPSGGRRVSVPSLVGPGGWSPWRTGEGGLWLGGH